MSEKPRIGVVSCSGECCSLGTLSRIATRLAIERRPMQTATICLPLFLAGETEEHGFAKEHPTISVDGCSKLCAAKAITKYSKEPAVCVNVDELLRQWGEVAPANRRVLDAKGMLLATRISRQLVEKVDALQGAA